MATKKGTISFMGDLTSPSDDFQKTQNEVKNLRSRLTSVGVSPEVSSPGPFISLLRLLTRPGSASLNALREYTNTNAGPTPGVLDPGAAFMRGLRGQQTTFGKDITRDLGASDKPWFKTSIAGIKIAPNTAGVLGTGLDLLNPTDPLNWILPGAGKVGAAGVVKGMPLLEKAFGTGAATELADKLGTDWVHNRLGQIGKTGEPSITTVGNLVGALGKKAADRGIENGVNPDAVSDIMLKAMKDRKLTANDRLIPKDKYALKMGLQVPIINKKIAEFNVPGTTMIGTGIARLGEKVADSPVGQAIGKNFSTTFTPNTVPGSVWTRMVNQGMEKPSIDTKGIIPDPTELNLISGKEAYGNIIKEAQGTAGRTTVREQDFEAALDTALKGLTAEDRKQLMQGLINPDAVLPAHLTKPLQFLKAAREKMVEDYKALGVNFTPLENYVPFVTVGKPLTRSESDLLRGAFGPKIRKSGGKDLIDLLGPGVDSHLMVRTINALDPAEVNRVLGREWLTEDAGVAMARRGIKAIRGQEATTFLHGVMEKYGLTIDDLTTLKNLPEGYVLVSPTIETSGRVLLNPVKTAEGQAFALPEEFAKAYNEYTEMMYNPNKANELMKFFDQSTRAYKTVAYMWNPGHIPRDFMSNVYNLWLGGMRNPLAFLKSAKVLREVGLATKAGKHGDEWSNLLNPEDLTLEGVENASKISVLPGGNTPTGGMLQYPQWQGTSTELYDSVRDLGLTETSGVLNEFQQAGKDWSVTMGGGPVGKYTDVMRKATRLNDNLARIAGVIDNLEKGMTLEQAVGATKKVLFDYNQLTAFEKKFMKRVVPFYTWMRKNIPLQVEMLLTHPGKYATTYKAMQDIGTPEDGSVPSFITQAGGVQVESKSGNKINMLPSLPFSDLSKLPTGTEQMRELLGSVNPAIRALPEMAANVAFFSGQPLENYKGELVRMPFATQLEKMGLPKDSLPLIPKRTLGYLLNQIPPLRNLDVVTNPENQRQGSKALSIMGGPQIYKQDWADKAAVYENRDKLRDLIRVLEDKGITVPTTKELQAAIKLVNSKSKKGKGKISMM